MYSFLKINYNCFCYFLVCKTQFHVPDASVGLTAGNIQGIYSLAQSLSGVFLGHLTDRLGRRPTIIIGMVAASIGTLGK